MKQSVQLLLLVVLCSAQFAKAQTVTDVKDIAESPYAAFLEFTGGSGNGAIISDTQVLTSASILNVPAGTEISIYVGNLMQRIGYRFKTKNFQKHPSYNPSTLENNVAIITIDGTFKGLTNVKPIAMRSSPIVNPVNCVSIGYGVRVNGSGTSELRRVNYQLVTDQECATKLGAQPSTIQCASSIKGPGMFELVGLPLVCDNRLIGVQAALSVYSFTDAQPIDLFTELSAASVQEFVLRFVPRPNYVNCN